MKRDIIHNIIQSGGRTEIKKLKKITQQVYVDSEKFEEALIEVTEQIKEANKSVVFKLKEEYLKWFDPYFYLIPEN